MLNCITVSLNYHAFSLNNMHSFHLFLDGMVSLLAESCVHVQTPQVVNNYIILDTKWMNIKPLEPGDAVPSIINVCYPRSLNSVY